MKDIELSNFDASDKNLGEILFSSILYRVPTYQRPYSWGDDEISDFWNDLKSDAKTYFLGSFIFNYETMKKENVVEIIDGQQRILTITLLMCAIRDSFKDIGENGKADLIQRQTICVEDERGKMRNRIICGDSTSDCFRLFQNREFDDAKRKNISSNEHRKIVRNYDFLKERIAQDLKSIPNKADKIEYLHSLRTKISNLKVIWMKIEDESDAYEIFETVNARGVELSVSDLLKNLIFRKIMESGEISKNDVKKRWSEIEDNVQTTGTDLKKFLRYYWLSKNSFVTEKKLFKEIKEKIGDYNIFLNDLVKASEIYSMLYDFDPETWKDIKDGSAIAKSLNAMKIMRVTQCHVLFMCILRNKDSINTNPKNIFELIEKFTFHYAAICNFPTNRVEKIYSKFALKIEEAITEGKKEKQVSGKVQKIFSELSKELQKERPKREEFIARFEDISYGKSENSRIFIKYILSKINDQYGSREYKINFDNVNIEHILPQKPGKNWNLLKYDIKDYVDKLGNLTIIDRSINSSIGNKDITEKKEGLKKSKIELNVHLLKDISDNSVWGRKEIEARQKKLSEIAFDKAWKF